VRRREPFRIEGLTARRRLTGQFVSVVARISFRQLADYPLAVRILGLRGSVRRTAIGRTGRRAPFVTDP